MKKLAFLFAFVALQANAQLSDIRMCNEVKRDADGDISRSLHTVSDFKALHPCPSTGLRYGSCPGWSVDHVIPLACKGCDSVENMQWLKLSIKSCAGKECKDRWERKIYCEPMVIIK